MARASSDAVVKFDGVSSTTGASALTLTACEVVPTFICTSVVTVEFAATRTFVTSTGLKPRASTRTE